MGAALQTKPTTTLAAYLDLQDYETPSISNCRCSTNSGRDCSASSLPPKRNLSRTARAIMFGRLLIKRVRERKSHHQQKSDGWMRNLSLDSGSLPVKEERESEKRELGGIYQENRDIQLVSLRPLSTGSPQSFPISISESKISNKKTSGNEGIGVKQRDIDQRRRSCYALNSGVRLLVVSLGVTVMQGRVIAIVITSIWVYFFGWMQKGDRCLKKKETKFIETEVTGTLRSEFHNRMAWGG